MSSDFSLREFLQNAGYRKRRGKAQASAFELKKVELLNREPETHPRTGSKGRSVDSGKGRGREKGPAVVRGNRHGRG